MYSPLGNITSILLVRVRIRKRRDGTRLRMGVICTAAVWQCKLSIELMLNEVRWEEKSSAVSAEPLTVPPHQREIEG